MAVAIEDTEGNIQVYEKAVRVAEQGEQYVLYGPENTIQAVIPIADVMKLVTDD
ncbi:hypothetical protein [Pseudomonas aeruginosa]